VSERSKGLTKTAFLLTVIVAGSKALGFGREMVIAYVYGAGTVTDAYAIALGVVTTANLLVATYLTTTFVPAYTRLRVQHGEGVANALTNTNLSLAILVNTVLLVLLQTLVPFLSRLVAPGFGDSQTLLVSSALRILLFQLPFLAAIALFSGFLKARQSFYGPNLIGFPLNIAIATVCLILGAQKGVEGLAIASLCGTVSQILLLVFWLPKEQYRAKLAIRITPEVREGIALLLPALVGSAVIELNLWVNRILASGLAEGSVASINFAMRIVSMVQSLLIVPASEIVYSVVSEHAAKKDAKEMLETLWHWVRLVLFITLPIVAIAIPTSTDIVRIVYERGQFDADATLMTTNAFIWYLPSILSSVFYFFLVRFYYALRDTKTPMFCGAIAITVNIAFSIILVRRMGTAGLALSSSIGSMVSAFLLLLFLRKKLGPIGFGFTAKSILKMTICAIVCFLCVFMIIQFLSGQHALLRFAICSVVGCCIYLALTIVTKVTVASEALQFIKLKVLKREN